MLRLQNHTPLSFDYGADELMLLDILAANADAEVDPSLASVALLDYTGTTLIRLGRGHNLWGPYGEGLVGFAPMNTDGMVLFDWSDDSLSELEDHGMSGNAYYDFLQINEEEVFLLPADANNWGWQNIRTGVFTAGAAHGLGNAAFQRLSPCLIDGRPSAVLWPDPAGALTGPYYLDIETRAITASGLTFEPRGPCLLAETGVFVADGRILDPTANTITDSISLGSGYHFLLPDRTFAQIPYASSALFNYDFSRTLVRQTPTWSTGNKAAGGFWCPNGDVGLVPWDVDTVSHWDRRRNIITDGPAISGSDQFNNGVLMPDGRVVLSSRRKEFLHIYTHCPEAVAVPGSSVALQGAWFNGWT